MSETTLLAQGVRGVVQNKKGEYFPMPPFIFRILGMECLPNVEVV